MQLTVPAEFTALSLLSSDYSFSFIIGKSRSENHKTVRLLCTQARYFVENGDGFIFAVFGADRRQIDYALEVVRLAGDWKGTIFFYKGKRSSLFETIRWMHCYKKALNVANIDAHCLGVYVRRIESERVYFALLYPCDQLKGYYRPEYHHPSPYIEQIEAGAKAIGYANCPFFNLAKFQYRVVPFDSPQGRWFADKVKIEDY